MAPPPTTTPNLNTQDNNLSLPCTPPPPPAPHFPAPPAPLRSSCSHRLLPAGVSGITAKQMGICEKDLVFAFASAMSASLEEASVTLEKSYKWSRGGGRRESTAVSLGGKRTCLHATTASRIAFEFSTLESWLQLPLPQARPLACIEPQQ